MTNKDFTRFLIEQHPGMYFRDASKIVKLVFDAVREALLNGATVRIPRVGVIRSVYLGDRDGLPWTTPNGIQTTLKNRVHLKLRASRQFTNLLTEKFNRSGIVLDDDILGDSDE